MNDLTFCQYRLPCGHCERLDRKCPYISGSNYFSTSPLTPPYNLNKEAPNITYGSSGLTSIDCSELHPDSLINISTEGTIYDINSTGIALTSSSELHPNGFTTATNNLEKGS
jgi:hypothetical protein